MTAIVLQTEHATDVSIPTGIDTLAQFRRWAFSAGYPTEGRIDFINGSIEVDISPEDLFLHNFPKTELTAVLHQWVKERQLGWVFSDRSRVTCTRAGLSAEPDACFVSQASVTKGRVKFRSLRTVETGGAMEIVGPPDIAVEFVSDSSVRKDTVILPERYFAAGVAEYWLIDARGRALRFDLFVRGRDEFVQAVITEDGYRVSAVIGAAVRLSRKRTRRSMWDYTLEMRSLNCE